MTKRHATKAAVLAACGLLLTGCAVISGSAADGSNTASSAGSTAGRGAAPSAVPTSGEGDAAPAASADGKLATLYRAVITSCNSDAAVCDGLNIDGAGAVADAVTAFCARFAADASPVLLDTGAIQPGTGAQGYDYLAEIQTANLNTDNTAQGGNVVPNGADVGCVTPVNPGGFALWLAEAPPAQLNSTDLPGISTMPFGHPCVTQYSDQFGTSSLDLSCITKTGWAFDVAEGQTANVPSADLQKTYDALVADLSGSGL